MPSPLGKVARRSRDGRGITAVRIRRKPSKNETFYRTSPAPFGGTLPFGEGFGCAINRNFPNPVAIRGFAWYSNNNYIEEVLPWTGYWASNARLTTVF